MKILFIGSTVSADIADGLSGISIAGNKMQLALLEGLKQNGAKVSAITVYPVSAFDKLWYSREIINLCDGIKSVRVPFINIPFIKQYFQTRGVYREAKKALKSDPDTIVMPFNMYPQTGYAADRLRKEGYRVVPLLADLPIDDHYDRKGISKILRDSFYNKTAKYIRPLKEVIVLNKHAAEVYCPDAKYMVMDGIYLPPEEICDQQENASPAISSDGMRHIVYGGSLNDYSGVKELVMAMEQVDVPDLVLDIYGSGAAEGFVKEHESAHIKYHGRVSADEMRKIQQSAWLLVNPRPVDDPIAMVTFPSKIFEYMASGVPTLSTRLNGFTEEYEDKLFFAENLTSAISEISELSEADLEQRSCRAREFVLREKNALHQTARIIDFIGQR